MIACLRSARFIYPDDSASVFVELRRRGAGNDKKFVVTRRFPRLQVIHNKSWDTINEARVHWDELVHELEDQGLRRCDSRIIGFHEED